MPGACTVDVPSRVYTTRAWKHLVEKSGNENSLAARCKLYGFELDEAMSPEKMESVIADIDSVYETMKTCFSNCSCGGSRCWYCTYSK